MIFLPELISILLLQAVYVIIPGAGFALVVRLSETKGVKAAIQASLGSAASTLLIATSAFLGMDLLLQSFPGIIKGAYVLGAIWLLWQAVLTLRVEPKHKGRSKQKKQALHPSSFIMGLLQSLLNVESVFFYAAIITQFKALNVPTMWQYAAILEMCSFTIIWSTLIVIGIRHIPHHHKILTHPITRSILAALFVMSAGTLILGLR